MEGKTKFQPREFPRSWSKAKDGKEKRFEKEKRKRRLRVVNNNGQLSIANATKAAWAKKKHKTYRFGILMFARLKS